MKTVCGVVILKISILIRNKKLKGLGFVLFYLKKKHFSGFYPVCKLITIIYLLFAWLNGKVLS